MIGSSTGDRTAGSIVARLALGLAVLSLILAAFVTLVVWSGLAARAEMLRAEQSFRQLETARNIEAAFGRYLLGEMRRRLTGGPAAEVPETAAVRAALLGYRRMIGDEIAASGSEAERDAERAELIRAAALGELFEAIETEAMLARDAGSDPTARARVFVNQIAGDRDRAIRAILYEIGQDERQEIAEASAAIARLRDRTLALGAVLGVMFLTGAVVFGTSVRTGLLRPIRRLAGVAEAFGHGDRAARVPAGLPGEFSALGARFNEMAGELAAREEVLEGEVATRTDELARANAELRRVDATRRRFFANVSHELRTPVTVLLGEAQLARRNRGDAQAMGEALDRIQASGGFLRRRLDDLMRLARSEDGALQLHPSEISFPEPVREAVELARGYAAASEVELTAELQEAATVVADPETLRQAALALIDNAVKFSPPGGIVTVSARVGTDEVAFTVSDQGPGFQGDETVVLDRYAQESAGRAAGGSGLGLAIARWIAEQHGGTITAANRADGGATVTVSIPRSPAV